MEEEKRSDISTGKDLYSSDLGMSIKDDTLKRVLAYANALSRPLVVREEGQSYQVSCPSLPGCVAEGDTIEEAMENGKEARKKWVEFAMENEDDLPPEDAKSGYSGQLKLRLPKSLHREMAEHAREEGMSLNTYILYLLSRNDALYNSTRKRKKQEETKE